VIPSVAHESIGRQLLLSVEMHSYRYNSNCYRYLVSLSVRSGIYRYRSVAIGSPAGSTHLLHSVYVAGKLGC